MAEDDWQSGIRDLISRSRICFLATSGENGPESSMAPYALHNGHLLLHLSSLAAHSSNITKNQTIGLMICAPEVAGESPLALPRLSLQGEATAVSEADYEVAKQGYIEAIPDAEPLFSFGDFRLFKFTPSHIRWVGGFGKARDIPLAKWLEVFHIDGL